MPGDLKNQYMPISDLFIETERLLIRPFTMDDIEPSYQMN
jgi:hypothetical protein